MIRFGVTNKLTGYNQTPCLNFPPTWPVYTPAAKLFQLAADWLVAYASFLELDVWTASTITKTSWNDSMKTWVLTVEHLVFATGSGGCPKVPDISEKTQHMTLLKISVVTVSTSQSWLDFPCLAVYNDDFPTELADPYNTSLPWAVVRRLHQRMIPMVAETADKAILDGLAKVGFKTNFGIHGAGSNLALSRFQFPFGHAARLMIENVEIKAIEEGLEGLYNVRVLIV
ncbi:hypothetical protein EV424DRAFT_1342998 [Suillus variegatus]|nr:hypothetical protein EV424DRAFT_1342998 [Suillus variegatus]